MSVSHGYIVYLCFSQPYIGSYAYPHLTLIPQLRPNTRAPSSPQIFIKPSRQPFLPFSTLYKSMTVQHKSSPTESEFPLEPIPKATSTASLEVLRDAPAAKAEEKAANSPAKATQPSQKNDGSQYVHGIRLWILCAALSVVVFLVLLNAGIISTVSTASISF